MRAACRAWRPSSASASRFRALVNALDLLFSVLTGVALIVVAGCSAPASGSHAGEGLFAGKEPLKATIRGHQSSLPLDVATCNGCHDVGNREAAAATSAPRIDRSLLLEARERRGGPPSSYDVASFCKMLRTGIDPAYVLVARVMPTYEVSDAQCASLWRFLTEGTR
jgi:hypothetical protein